MRITLSFFFLYIIFSVNLLAQNKRDYQWISGPNQDTLPGVDGIIFDFNLLPMEPTYERIALSFSRNKASICDRDGKLLFYSNGCAIANRFHEQMENGDSINAGRYFDEWIGGNCLSGLRTIQDLVILPDPGSETGYYMIYKPSEYYPELGIEGVFRYEYFKYSYVDMALDEGKGAVVEKDIPIHRTQLISSFMSAIPHSNQKDWWIMSPGEGQLIFRLLLTENGFEKVDSQSVQTVWNINAHSGSGNAKFSPDGTQYVTFNKFNGLWLYDFDRTTGLLSNDRHVEWTPPTNIEVFSTVEFSPNSRFLYLGTQREVYQVDTWEDNLEDGLILIAEWDGTLDPLHTTFFSMALGPDCKIYIMSGSNTYSIHVIHQPDEKGLACDLVQRGLRLKTINSVGGLPYFPRFRVDEEEKCDTTITMVNGVDLFWRKDLVVYPNPAKDFVSVELPEEQRGNLVIINMEGVLMKHLRVDSHEVVIPINELTPGTYSIEFIPENNTKKNIYTTRLVKL